MLFRAEIPNDILIKRSEEDQPRERLCNQLYIFLRDYVPTRLIYENDAEIEDCIQDTIMYMLERLDELSEEEIKETNLEKFFYNRAKSFISMYVGKLKSERALINKYKAHVRFMKELEELKEIEYIDFLLLDSILKRYRLGGKRLELFKSLSVNKLVKLGYNEPLIDIEDEDLEMYDPNNVLNTISYAVVDEYLVNAAENRGSDQNR